MPVMGAGIFAAGLGLPVVVATLVLHLIFGAVLGFSFGKIGWAMDRAATQVG